MHPDDPARTISQTPTGELASPSSTHAQAPEPARLLQLLSDLFLTRAEMHVWLQTGNPGFDGRSPKELIEADERDLLWEMVHQTRQQAFA